MFIQPIYNILLLPNVTYFFKKDFFEDRGSELKTDTELLTAMVSKPMTSIPSAFPQGLKISATKT